MGLVDDDHGGPLVDMLRHQIEEAEVFFMDADCTEEKTTSCSFETVDHLQSSEEIVISLKLRLRRCERGGVREGPERPDGGGCAGARTRERATLGDVVLSSQRAGDRGLARRPSDDEDACLLLVVVEVAPSLSHAASWWSYGLKPRPSVARP